MENKENIIKTEDINIDVPTMLDEAEKAAKEQGKIPAFLIPTVYGKGALIKKEYEEYLIHEKGEALPVTLNDQVKVEDIIKNGAIGGGAFTPDELKYGKAYSFICEADLCLPDLRWKVTKPGMICKGMHYELNKLNKFEGEVELHEAGYHYAWDPNNLFTWYRRFDPNNEVYLVQVSGGGNKSIVMEDEHGVGVTDRILFVKKIDWKDLL